MQVRMAIWLFAFLSAFASPALLFSQPSSITIKYVGSTVVNVTGRCSATLNDAQIRENVVVQSNIGNNIVRHYFDSTATGIRYNQPLQLGCPFTLYWYAEDSGGNTASASFVVNFVETEKPVVTKTARDTIAYCNYNTGILGTLNHWYKTGGGAMATDNCGPLRFMAQIDAGGPLLDSAATVAAYLERAQICDFQTVRDGCCTKVRGLLRVNFFAVDPSGNFEFAGSSFFVARDTAAPRIIGTPVAQVNCSSNNNASVENWVRTFGGASFRDDCSTATLVNFSWVTSENTTGTGTLPNGPFPTSSSFNCDWWVDVSYRMRDDCGNERTQTFRLHVKDVTPPTLSPLPQNIVLYCPSALPTAYTGTATDNCTATPTLNAPRYTYSDTTCVGNYRARITWSATDACGNTGTTIQDFLIRDTIAPVFTRIPANLTVSCDSVAFMPIPIINTDVQARDDCGRLESVAFTGLVSTQNSNIALCEHYNYTLTRFYTATDACGNTATARQVVTVRDTRAPVLRGVSDTTIICRQILPPVAPPSAIDQCQGILTSLSVNVTNVSGSCVGNYDRILVWSVADACGNTGSFTQTVRVRDTIRPEFGTVPANITVSCAGIPTEPTAVNLNLRDNCDNNVQLRLTTNLIRDPSTANCSHWSNYIIQRTWTAIDGCNNSSSAMQTITVMDNNPPVIGLPSAFTRPAAVGQCSAPILIPAPLYLLDDCTTGAVAVISRDSAAFTARAGQPLSDAVVDTITLRLPVTAVPPRQAALADGTLVIDLINADAEATGESFTVVGENNTVLGVTTPTDRQCGNGTTTLGVTAAQLTDWLVDGQLTLRLIPNGTGATAINAICPNNRAKATLSFNAATERQPIVLQYSVDGGPNLPFPPAAPVSLATGDHTVRYVATDCSGNVGSASVTLTVRDAEPPTVTAPAALNAYLEANTCLRSVALPFPTITENCATTGNLNITTSPQALIFEPNANAGIVPRPVDIVITGVLANALTNGTLRISHIGDNAQAGEFFEIFDENNVRLGVTVAGKSEDECKLPNETVIPVTAAQINAWAADGTARFRLVPNTNPVGFSDFISPCKALNAQSRDSISTVSANLNYPYAAVTYEVRKSNTVVSSGPLVGGQTAVNVGVGQFTVNYYVSDASGNTGSASFALVVRDTIRPVAVCAPSKTVFTHPSGLINATVTPAEMNAGSTDNCTAASALTLTASQTLFTCNVAGQTVPVTLTVRDSSGNRATCSTLVRVETSVIQPTYTPNICEGSSIQLFANPPEGPGNPTYTYTWVNPVTGFTSVLQNPLIENAKPSDRGSYRVVVTGPTGCTATGVVQVDLVGRPDEPSLTVASNSICIGDNVTLRSGAYSGANVVYRWYSGTPANPTLLGSTSIRDFVISNPPPGTYQYYVQVSINGCLSLPSQVRTITVNSLPVARVDEDRISICEGQSLRLGTPIQGNGVSYSWTGPDGFGSVMQYPTVITNVSKAKEGDYSLVVNQNGCASAPATVTVTVREKPAPPDVVADNNKVCVGAIVNFVATTPPGSSISDYIWRSPRLDSTVTRINALTVRNVALNQAGVWSVSVVQRGCTSDPRSVVLQIQDYPQVRARANTPLCIVDTLKLTASADRPEVGFSWTGPSGFTSFEPNPRRTPAESGVYTLAGTTTFGCRSTNTVTVYAAPRPIVNNITDNAPICSDGTPSVTLQATYVDLNGPMKYRWTGPNGFTSTATNPMVPNFSAVKNGTYIVEITDTIGCRSLPFSKVVRVEDLPATPVLQNVIPICENSNATVFISNRENYSFGSYTFQWQTPTGVRDTTAPVLNINPVTLRNGGNYSVVARTANCASLPSAAVNLVVNAIPASPVVTTNSPLCEGDTLRLGTEFVTGAQYEWTGPFGFTASTFNPFIAQVRDVHVGNYRASITINGCKSPFGTGQNVEVRMRPTRPEIRQPIGAVCLQQTDTVRVEVTPLSQTAGATYTWFNAQAGVRVGQTTEPIFRLSDLSGLTPGINKFTVVARANGCNSLISEAVDFSGDVIPGDRALAGDDFNACDRQPAALRASPSAVATGVWRQVSGPATTIASPANFRTDVIGLTAGQVYQYEWVLSNGACENYARDTIKLTGVNFEVARAVKRVDTCFTKEIKLRATQGTTTTGFWSQPIEQEAFGVRISDINNPNSNVTGLAIGKNVFVWTLRDIGCGVSTDTMFVFNFDSRAFAGIDFSFCDRAGCAPLNAAVLNTFEQGKWSSPDADLQFASLGNPSTSVCSLKVGRNVLIWTINDGLCGAKGRDTVIVDYQLTPSARQDVINVNFAETKEIKVLLNDLLPPKFSEEKISDPLHGKLTRKGTGTYTYLPDFSYDGTDEFIYEVCNLECKASRESQCDKGKVTINVAKPTDCEIPTVITPNNDGVNDVFFIPCLGDGPSAIDNEVIIFNQWGNEVFYARPYKNDWRGTFGGRPLPAGTYFYIVDYRDTKLGVKKGFLMIQY